MSEWRREKLAPIAWLMAVSILIGGAAGVSIRAEQERNQPVETVSVR